MVAPNLRKGAEWWDNQSDLFRVTALWENAWESADACEAACESWVLCIQWSYVEDLCRMDDKAVTGQGSAPAMSERETALKTTSGWLVERLDEWTCE
ncbi:hypothetical protein VTH06DRAFT_8789 [Thermothelomyces fergusii]